MKFNNLLAEMAKLGITQKELAKLTGIKHQTLIKKLTGEKEFRLSDILKIRNLINPNLSLEYLFNQNLA